MFGGADLDSAFVGDLTNQCWFLPRLRAVHGFTLRAQRNRTTGRRLDDIERSLGKNGGWRHKPAAAGTRLPSACPWLGVADVKLTSGHTSQTGGCRFEWPSSLSLRHCSRVLPDLC